MQKTFRLFLSSTFGDFQAEREALKERVWPQLGAYCASRNASFQVVDLRWGISESDGLAHDTLRICLDEIAHCQKLSPKPNFLMLLGNRYGWRPLPPEIPADEFDLVIQEATLIDTQRLRDWYILDNNEPRSSTTKIGEVQRLRDWYKLDNNALPPHYVLRARGEAHSAYSDWQGIESDLLKILRASATKLGRTPLRNELYFYSATHQEIVRGSLIVSDADQHVFAFIREIDGLDVKSPLAKNFTDLDRNGLLDTEAQGLRLELREQFIKKLPAEENKLYCKVQWQEQEQGQEKSPISTEHIDQLCEYVDKSLRLVIGQELDAASTDNLTQEITAHRDSARKLTGIFIGREKQLTQLADAVRISLGHIERTDEVPGIVWVNGPGGVGKSAFMARALENARNQYPNAIVIERFIGTTHRSCNLFTFLADLLAELAKSRKNDETLPEGGLQELIEILPQRMSWATAEKPLIVFIDALDQFNDSFFVREHIWLPAVLPPYVVVVLSVLDGPMSVTLQNRFPKTTGIDLAPFNAKEGEVMLDALLLKGGDKARQLSDSQKKLVLDAFQQDGRPLYLSLAAVECRRWASWDKPAPFPNQLEELIQRFIAKLQVSHGHIMVDRALAYLSAVRFGISDQEMRDLLWKDPAALAEFKSRKNPDQPEVNSLPTVIWSRIYFDLAPYLVEQGATGAWLYRFYHRVIAEEVTRCHLAGHAAEVHGWIADYFAGQDLHLQDGMRQVPNFRKLAEEPWQRIKAGQLDEAEKVLTDFRFAMAKCEAGLFEELLEDYRLLIEAVRQIGQTVSKTLGAWDALLRNGAHILRRGNSEWPAQKILLQLAMEHADDSPASLAAEKWIREGRCDWVWMKKNDRPKIYMPDPCLMVLEGHSGAVRGAKLLPDCSILSWSDDTTLRLWHGTSGAEIAVLSGHKSFVNGVELLAKNRILSWSADGTLRLWSTDKSAETIVFRGHEGAVDGVKLLGEDHILSWSSDHTLRLWTQDGGPELLVFREHTAAVIGAKLISNKRILSWSADCTLRLWTIDNSTKPKVFRGHKGPVSGAELLDENHILSWSEDHTLSIWCITDDPPKPKVLPGHTGAVSGVKLLTKHRILSWSSDCTLRLWNVGNGADPVVFPGHEAAVIGAELFGEYHVISWSYDGTIRIWNILLDVEPVVLRGHKGWVLGAQLLANNLILSWSYDKTLRLWDGGSGEPLGLFAGHTGLVEGANVLPDGRFISWSLDKTLRLWDVSSPSGYEELLRHNSSANSAQLLSDGRILSCSNDYTLKLWDGAEGKALAELRGHKYWERDAKLLSDGRILSWSNDHTLRLWDGNTGEALAVLEGHTEPVCGALLQSNGNIVSWSDNGEIIMWNGISGEKIRGLPGHTRWADIQVLPDDRILSFSVDKTLRLWTHDGDPSPLVFREHEAAVRGAKLISNKRILSWSADCTLRLWSTDKSAETIVFRGHKGAVKGAELLDEDHILSWSEDHTLSIWCITDKPPKPKVLPDHTGAVFGANLLTNGRILSWADDSTLRLWDIRDEPKSVVFKGHSARAKGGELLFDGRILSWSFDRTLRLWDAESGVCLDCLPADWVETGDFPGNWQKLAERAGTCVRGGWWAQAIDRRVSVTNVATKDKARWHANADSKILNTPTGLICAHNENELVFLEIFRGNRRLM